MVNEKKNICIVSKFPANTKRYKLGCPRPFMDIPRTFLGKSGIEHSLHFRHFAQGLNCLLLLLNTAVPTESMTMAFVELDECRAG